MDSYQNKPFRHEEVNAFFRQEVRLVGEAQFNCALPLF
jgi:hypothetical protein